MQEKKIKNLGKMKLSCSCDTAGHSCVTTQPRSSPLITTCHRQITPLQHRKHRLSPQNIRLSGDELCWVVTSGVGGDIRRCHGGVWWAPKQKMAITFF